MSQEYSFKTITKHDLNPENFTLNDLNKLISVKYPDNNDLITGAYIQESWKKVWTGRVSRQGDYFTLSENINGKECILSFRFDSSDIPDRCSGILVAMHTAPDTHFGFKQVIKISSDPNRSNGGLEIYFLEDTNNHNSKVFMYYNPKNIEILAILVKEIALINPTKNIKTTKNQGALSFFEEYHIW